MNECIRESRSIWGLIAAIEATPEFIAEQGLLDFTQTILGIMAEQGISRKALAKRLHLRRSVVDRLLDGDRNMSVFTVALIVHALGMTFSICVQPRKEEPK